MAGLRKDGRAAAPRTVIAENQLVGLSVLQRCLADMPFQRDDFLGDAAQYLVTTSLPASVRAELTSALPELAEALPSFERLLRSQATLTSAEPSDGPPPSLA